MLSKRNNQTENTYEELGRVLLLRKYTPNGEAVVLIVRVGTWIDAAGIEVEVTSVRGGIDSRRPEVAVATLIAKAIVPVPSERPTPRARGLQ